MRNLAFLDAVLGTSVLRISLMETVLRPDFFPFFTPAAFGAADLLDTPDVAFALGCNVM